MCFSWFDVMRFMVQFKKKVSGKIHVQPANNYENPGGTRYRPLLQNIRTNPSLLRQSQNPLFYGLGCFVCMYLWQPWRKLHFYSDTLSAVKLEGRKDDRSPCAGRG